MNSMDDINENNTNKLLDGQKKLSSDFEKKIFYEMFPYHGALRSPYIDLTDSFDFLLDGMRGQVRLLEDLGNKIKGNEDIAGHGLVSFADVLNKQLGMLGVIQTEFYSRGSDEINELQRVIDQKNRKISELQNAVSVLKGGAV